MNRVLFFVPFGSYTVHNQLDAVFAAKFRLEGVTPAIIRCDGLYRHCDVLAWSGERAAQDCRVCQQSGDQLFEAFGLPSLQMSSYLTPADHQAAQTWVDALDPEDYLNARFGGLPIGYWVISSIFSYFRITDQGLVLPQVREVHRNFLKSSLLTYWALTRLLTEQAPRAVFIFNTRFAPYRVAYEVARELGIEEFTHERGCFDDSFVLYNNRTCLDTEPIFEIFESWRDICLSSAQLASTLQYLRNRECGRDLNYPAFSEAASESHTIRHALRIPEGARVLAVFTSGESEGAYCGGYSEVTTQFDRIDTLIDLYRSRTDYLVVRHHPHMGGNAQEPPENYYLTRAYQQMFTAPANVRIIMPSEPISSYALLRNVDAVIAFFSSVGYEAAGRGVAAAALSQCPFSKAMRYQVPTQHADLENLIGRLFAQTDAVDPADLCRAFRFIYAYIYRLSVQFRSFGIKNNYEMDLRIDDLNRLAHGHDPELDRICRSVLQRTPIGKVPEAADHALHPGEEADFFADYAASIRSERQSVRTRSRLYSASRIAAKVAVVRIQRPEGQGPPPFPDWSARSRHSDLVPYSLSLPAHGPDAADSLAAVARLVATVKEQYVVIALPTSVYLDEAFLPGALKLLLEDRELAWKGVLSGAWTLDREGVVDQEFCTKRVPVPDLSAFALASPGFSDPLQICSLCLFRKQGILQLFDQLLATSAAHPATTVLTLMLDDPTFLKTLMPLALISHRS